MPTIRWTKISAVWSAIALVVVFAAPEVRAETAETARFSTRVELYYRLTAQIATTPLDARVEAGARLLMARSLEEHRLSLLRPLEPAWKFYRVDPLGPGGEAKMAAVVTLAEGSWQELEAARAEVAADAAARWARWQEAGLDAGQNFDGSFAYLVLGPAEGRFEVEMAGDGRVESVSNRLTDRWLSGPLGELFERWQRSAQAGERPPAGYWFWNPGAKPFAWEPHTYHAFVTALQLMEAPYLPPSGPAGMSPPPPSWEHSPPGLGEKLAEVLAVLTPKARGRLRPGNAGPTRLQFTARALDDHRWWIEGKTPPSVSAKGQRNSLTLSRQLIYDAERQTAVTDSLRATMETKSGRVTLHVGFKPADTATQNQR